MSDFVSPPVCLHQKIEFKPNNAGNIWCVAFVTSVSEMGIEIVWQMSNGAWQSMQDVILPDGDPRLSEPYFRDNMESGEGGVWRHTADTVAQMTLNKQLLERIESLEDIILTEGALTPQQKGARRRRAKERKAAEAAAKAATPEPEPEPDAPIQEPAMDLVGS